MNLFKKSHLFLFWTCIVLLSSCNTRKGLDAFFEIPFQKTLNVSKAQLQQDACAELEWNQVKQIEVSKQEFDTNYVDDFSSDLIHFKNEITLLKYSSSFKRKTETHPSNIPLYLLYQQFKVDLV